MKFFLIMAIAQFFSTIGFADEARGQSSGDTSIRYVCFRTTTGESYGQCTFIGLFLIGVSHGGTTVTRYVECPSTLTACLPLAELANKSLATDPVK